MPAYVVALRERTKDPKEMELYGQKARAADASKIKPLALFGNLETLEGTPFEGVVLLEFPTVADAKAWYNSPEYTAARQHRMKGADYRFMIVQGV